MYHPEYAKRSIILSGESYAGKYLPHFAVKINDHNSKTLHGDKDQNIYINLKAVLIGDPFVAAIR